MDLGVVNGTVRILEHDPLWAQEARRTMEYLRGILDGPDILEMQHVGSTAIEGIPAKPIIDIAVAIESPASVERYRAALEAEGFTYLGKVTDDDWMFHIGHPGRNDRTHHVHMITAGSRRWVLYLAFRDYLNAVPEAAKRYGDLKRELSGTMGDQRKLYHDKKAPLIDRLEADAFAWWEANGR